MAEDAAPQQPQSSPPALTPPLPVPAQRLTADTPMLDEEWPPEPHIWEFFYVWTGQAGGSCPTPGCAETGAESLQGALSPLVVQLLCLRCDTLRTAHPHRTEVII